MEPGKIFDVQTEEQREMIRWVMLTEWATKGYTTLTFSDDWKRVKKEDMSWVENFVEMEEKYNTLQ